MAACALLWSTGGLFIKIAPWHPLAIAGARSLIGGVVIWLYLKRPHFTWSRTQILCALAYAATMITFVAANKLTTAANAILLQYTAPLYAAFLGAALLKEKVHWFDWATIAVVVGGMVLFFLDKLSQGGMLGNLFAVASGVVFALAIVLLRKQKEGSPLESILLSHGITFVVGLPFIIGSFISRGQGAGEWAASSQWSTIVPGIGAILVLGIFQVGIASILLSYGVRHVTALQSLLTSILEPIFNPVWVFLILGEIPGPLSLAGGGLILVTITARSLYTVLAGRGQRQAEAVPPPG